MSVEATGARERGVRGAALAAESSANEVHRHGRGQRLRLATGQGGNSAGLPTPATKAGKVFTVGRPHDGNGAGAHAGPALPGSPPACISSGVPGRSKADLLHGRAAAAAAGASEKDGAMEEELDSESDEDAAAWHAVRSMANRGERMRARKRAALEEVGRPTRRAAAGVARMVAALAGGHASKGEGGEAANGNSAAAAPGRGSIDSLRQGAPAGRAEQPPVAAGAVGRAADLGAVPGSPTSPKVVRLRIKLGSPKAPTGPPPKDACASGEGPMSPAPQQQHLPQQQRQEQQQESPHLQVQPGRPQVALTRAAGGSGRVAKVPERRPAASEVCGPGQQALGVAEQLPPSSMQGSGIGKREQRPQRGPDAARQSGPLPSLPGSAAKLSRQPASPAAGRGLAAKAATTSAAAAMTAVGPAPPSRPSVAAGFLQAASRALQAGSGIPAAAAKPGAAPKQATTPQVPPIGPPSSQSAQPPSRAPAAAGAAGTGEASSLVTPPRPAMRRPAGHPRRGAIMPGHGGGGGSAGVNGLADAAAAQRQAGKQLLTPPLPLGRKRNFQEEDEPDGTGWRDLDAAPSGLARLSSLLQYDDAEPPSQPPASAQARRPQLAPPATATTPRATLQQLGAAWLATAVGPGASALAGAAPGRAWGGPSSAGGSAPTAPPLRSAEEQQPVRPVSHILGAEQQPLSPKPGGVGAEQQPMSPKPGGVGAVQQLLRPKPSSGGPEQQPQSPKPSGGVPEQQLPRPKPSAVQVEKQPLDPKPNTMGVHSTGLTGAAAVLAAAAAAAASQAAAGFPGQLQSLLLQAGSGRLVPPAAAPVATSAAAAPALPRPGTALPTLPVAAARGAAVGHSLSITSAGPGQIVLAAAGAPTEAAPGCGKELQPSAVHAAGKGSELAPAGAPGQGGKARAVAGTAESAGSAVCSPGVSSAPALVSGLRHLPWTPPPPPRAPQPAVATAAAAVAAGNARQSIQPAFPQPGLGGGIVQPFGHPPVSFRAMTAATTVASRSGPQAAGASSAPPQAARVESLGQGTALAGRHLAGVNVVQMGRLAAVHAAAAGLPPAVAWREAQRVVLQHTLRGLVGILQATKSPPASLDKLSSGVSYVIPTESRQKGVESLPTLPHLTIRPPGLREVGGQAVEDMLRTVQEQVVLGSVLPLKEENHMKSYLLLPGKRAGMLAQHGGRAQLVQGMKGLEPLLQDRSFVCLHYHLDSQGRLHPCTEASASGGGSGGRAPAGQSPGGDGQQQPSGSASRGYGMADSNVQVGIMLRKGVGGTCPLRSASRHLTNCGLLPALLNNHPPTNFPLAPPLATPRASVTPLGPGGAAAGAGGTGPSSSSQASSAAILAAAAAAAAAAGGGTGQGHPLGPPLVQGATNGSSTQADAAALRSSTLLASAPAQHSAAASPLAAAAPSPVAQPPPPPAPSIPAEPGAGDSSAADVAKALVDCLVGALEGPGEGQPSQPDTQVDDDGQLAAAGDTAGASAAAGSSAVPGSLVGEGAATMAAGEVAGAAGPAEGAEVAVDMDADVAADVEGEEGAEELLQEMVAEVARVATGQAHYVKGGALPQQPPLAAQPAAPLAAATSSARPAAPSPTLASVMQAPGQGGRLPAQAGVGVASGLQLPGLGLGRAQPGDLVPGLQNRLSLYTLSSRLELYVDETLWERLDSSARDVLHSVIRGLERLLLDQLAGINHRRLLDFCTDLQASVGVDALASPLANSLLPPTPSPSKTAPAPTPDPPERQAEAAPRPPLSVQPSAQRPGVAAASMGVQGEAKPAGGGEVSGARAADTPAAAAAAAAACGPQTASSCGAACSTCESVVVKLELVEASGEGRESGKDGNSLVRLSLQPSTCAAGTSGAPGSSAAAAAVPARHVQGSPASERPAAGEQQQQQEAEGQGGRAGRPAEQAEHVVAAMNREPGELSPRQIEQAQQAHTQQASTTLIAPPPTAAPACAAVPTHPSEPQPAASAGRYAAPPCPPQSAPAPAAAASPRLPKVEPGASPLPPQSLPSPPTPTHSSVAAPRSQAPGASTAQLPSQMVLVPVLGQLPGGLPGQVGPMLVPMLRSMVPPQLLAALDAAARTPRMAGTAAAAVAAAAAVTDALAGAELQQQAQQQSHAAGEAPLPPTAPANNCPPPPPRQAQGPPKPLPKLGPEATAALQQQPRQAPWACRPAGAAGGGESPGLGAQEAVAAAAKGVPAILGNASSASGITLGYTGALVLAAACLAAAEALGAARGFQVPWPYYLINTRDCFTHHLVPITTTVTKGGRTYAKTEYFFRRGEVPENYFAFAPPSLQPSAQQQAQPAGAASSAGTGQQLPGPSSCSPAAEAAPLGPPTPEKQAAGRDQATAELPSAPPDTSASSSSPPSLGQHLPASAQQQASEAAGAAAGTAGSPEPVAALPGAGGPCEAAGGKASKVDWKAMGLLPVGMTTYTEVFSSDELSEIERRSDVVDGKARAGLLPESCFHTSYAKGGSLKRTKYFFGARYMWTKEQMAEPDARVAAGVRVDVPPSPAWMREQVEQPLVGAAIIPDNFVDSIALNMYHDGSEGLQSHFDDPDRFARPIFSLRLFSDCRLSFGMSLYGYTNGAFCVPLPRGCVGVMEEGSYAANAVKHCVRPMDMRGKSAGMILRQIHAPCRREAERLHLEETCRWMAALSLNHSPRHLSAHHSHHPQDGQRVRGAGAGAGAPPRLKAVGAGVRKEVARVVEGMVRRLEAEERRAQSDATTAKLMVLSMVRKVEAAQRLGIDLSPPGASECFSVLDDIVSWVEHPLPPGQPPQPGQKKKKVPAPGPAVGSDAQEVAKVVHRMLRQLEAEERREQLQVQQVVSALVHATEQTANWEASGRQGPQPTYATSSALFSAVLMPPGKSGKPPKKKKRKALQAAPGNSTGAIPPHQILPLAAQLVGRVLLGAGGASGGPLNGVVQLLLQQYQLPHEAALRQALLVSVQGTSAATAAAAAGRAGAALPPVTVVQYQAAVSVMAGMLCQLSASCSSSGASTSVGSGSGGSARLPALGPSPAGTASGSGSKRGATEAAGAASAPRPTKKPRPAAPHAGGEGRPREGGRPGSAGVSKAPPLICFTCQAGVLQEEADSLWSCQGPCRRTFHPACRAPCPRVPSTMCNDCAGHSHTCFVCGEPGNVSKCSMGQCSRHYHWDCLAGNPLAKMAPSGKSFKCGLHYCAACGLSGDGIPMVQCFLCPSGYHIRCRPTESRILSKKFIVCSKHVEEQKAPA